MKLLMNDFNKKQVKISKNNLTNSLNEIFFYLRVVQIITDI